jgi:hypothetical protein
MIPDIHADLQYSLRMISSKCASVENREIVSKEFMKVQHMYAETEIPGYCLQVNSRLARPSLLSNILQEELHQWSWIYLCMSASDEKWTSKPNKYSSSRRGRWSYESTVQCSTVWACRLKPSQMNRTVLVAKEWKNYYNYIWHLTAHQRNSKINTVQL